MLRVISSVIIISIITVSTFSENITYKKHTFFAKFENIRLQEQLIAKGKKAGDIIKVSILAKLFDKPLNITDVRKNNKSFGKEIDFLINYTKTLISGTDEEILSFWHQQDRQGIKKSLEDKEIAKRNRDYLTKNPTLNIIGLVKHNNFLSILQNNDDIIGVTGTPIIHVGNKLYLVQKPNDLELAIIEASFNK